MNFKNLKECMDMFISRDKVPGLDCIVCKDHKEIYRYTAGFADKEAGRKMQGDEQYLIYSMTKLVTCISALQLLEKGKFLLNDPISRYLPEFEKMKVATNEKASSDFDKVATGKGLGEKASDISARDAKKPITIHNLFTMSSGLDYDLCSPAITEAIKEGKKTTRELVRAMSRNVLSFEPGARYQYSLSHDVLGALIEEVSGMTLGEYMKKNIFLPLGMEKTFFDVPKDEKLLLKMAALYTPDENRNPQKRELSCEYNLAEEYESGGAGLCSCVSDYATFLDALACGGVGKNEERIISSASIELMKSDHMTGMERISDFEDFVPGYRFGLGVRVHTDKSRSGALSPYGEFGWDGASGGFSLVDTKNKISLTYFQHYMGWERRSRYEITNALYSCLD
ncbi:MAG: beta-lactamase family protein [Ruminococcaceae bacterium]|nr:beta-lactamase family protein [Oscillospiraceae bacterium]